MDRAVARLCLGKQPRDPFNGRPLTEAQLVPQPVLRANIHAWLRNTDLSERPRVEVGKVKELLNMGVPCASPGPSTHSARPRAHGVGVRTPPPVFRGMSPVVQATPPPPADTLAPA